MIQLDEEDSFTKSILRKFKNRTEIIQSTDFPVFEKNIFVFKNLNLNNLKKNNPDKEIDKQSNDINFIFRIGLIKVNIKNENSDKSNLEENTLLNNNSVLIGNVNLKITSELKQLLKLNQYADFDLKIMSVDQMNYEIARIYLKIKIISKDNFSKEELKFDLIKEILYDPLENDKSIMLKVKKLSFY